MNFRDELARIIASDPRYSIEAYAFVLEALNHAKHQKLKAKGHATATRNAPRSQTANARRVVIVSKEIARFGPCHRSRALRSRPKIGPSPVRIARGDRARSLGRSLDFRHRRHRLQPDRRRRPRKNAQRFAVRLRQCLRLRDGLETQAASPSRRPWIDAGVRAINRSGRARVNSTGGLVVNPKSARMLFRRGRSSVHPLVRGPGRAGDRFGRSARGRRRLRPDARGGSADSELPKD